MNYIDFAIASSIFIIFFAAALMFSTNYFSNLSSLTKTSEFRSASENFFKIFFESKGTPENWYDYSNTPVKIGLAEDLYKIPILLKETSGYNRTNELISQHIVFDENCENKTWNNTVRVFDEDHNEFVYKLSDETFCSSQYLKEANITWEVNVSANQDKKFFIYYSADNGVNQPKFKSNLTVIGVWHLDEGSGSTTYDETGNNNDGTLYNGTQVSSQEPTWTSSCKSGNCLSFDGSNDYVNITTKIPDLTSATWEAWIYPHYRTQNCIIGKWVLDDGWQVALYGNKLMLETPNNVFYSSDSDIMLDQWSHITITVNGTHVSIYINGALDKVIPQSQAISNAGIINSIGELIPGSSWYFNGTIDEVRIYNRALSPEEINASYYAGSLVKETFPEESITAVSETKFNTLKNMSYDEVRKIVGENYNFRLQVSNETYGGNINMSANVGCSEYPKIVENKNGTVSKTNVKMCIWK